MGSCFKLCVSYFHANRSHIYARELCPRPPHHWHLSSLPKLCLAVWLSPDLPPAQRQNLSLPFWVCPLWDSRGDGECCPGGAWGCPGSQSRSCCADAQGTQLCRESCLPVGPGCSCETQNWALCVRTNPQLSVLGCLRSTTTLELYHHCWGCVETVLQLNE